MSCHCHCPSLSILYSIYISFFEMNKAVRERREFPLQFQVVAWDMHHIKKILSGIGEVVDADEARCRTDPNQNVMEAIDTTYCECSNTGGDILDASSGGM